MKHLFSMTVLFAFFCTMSVEAMEIQENEVGPSSRTIKKAPSKSPFEDYKLKSEVVTIKANAEEILKFSKYKRDEEEEERLRMLTSKR